jgi:tRNA 2-selenouridine synthase
MFESLVWSGLHRFDRERPVFVESESRKIGRLRVPEALIDAMWSSECVVLDAPVAVRVEMLKDEYSHYLSQPELLGSQLECLTALHGRDVIEGWQKMAREEEWSALVEELLVKHYDPAYTRSTLKHYPHLERASRHTIAHAKDSAFEELAAAVIEQLDPRSA